MTVRNLVLHIPHSSKFMRVQDRKLFFETKTLEQEIERLTDLYTDELFDFPYEKLVFGLSRLICDVERFPNPKAEPMTERGMWICYTKNSRGVGLKRVSKEHVQDVLQNYYYPHHLALENITSRILAECGRAIIIDCHSFPSFMPWIQQNSGDPVDICLGTDNFHTPKILLETCRKIFTAKGYRVALNTPFAGTLVPLKYLHVEKKVWSIMIEVRRELYYNSGEKIKNPKFSKIKKDIGEVLQAIENL